MGGRAEQKGKGEGGGVYVRVACLDTAEHRDDARRALANDTGSCRIPLASELRRGY
ncbi:hypothetical protein WME99_15000 [Sorangium sp. So ce136]|uniref:hypothetical protein n=1 Tax=Sorangium sp. So ce136 TaxID=3133284 RepID=UPI003F124D85